jgi:hypothetical protein
MIEMNNEKFTIWDLAKSQRFRTLEGELCEVITPTMDGKGLLARYLEGESKGVEDFIFSQEIDFSI